MMLAVFELPYVPPSVGPCVSALATALVVSELSKVPIAMCKCERRLAMALAISELAYVLVAVRVCDSPLAIIPSDIRVTGARWQRILLSPCTLPQPQPAQKGSQTNGSVNVGEGR